MSHNVTKHFKATIESEDLLIRSVLFDVFAVYFNDARVSCEHLADVLGSCLSKPVDIRNLGAAVHEKPKLDSQSETPII
jgi:hypothetical protein